MTNSLFLKTACILTALLLSLSNDCQAWGAKLTSPEIGYRVALNDKQEADMKAIHDFMVKQLVFIDGSFVNEFSRQRFGGNSAQTAKFISLLKDSGIWQVSVSFADLGDEKTAIKLHDGQPRITIP